MVKVLCVKWRDSVSVGGWNYPSEMQEWRGQIITSYGFLVREDKQDLVIAQSQGSISDGSPTYCNWLSIPKCCVFSREVVSHG